MATSRSRKSSAGSASKGPERPRIRPMAFLGRWIFRAILAVILLGALGVGLYRGVNPPTTIYMLQEQRRLGGIERDWADADSIAPVMLRAAVAAEDANFCRHWGFDMNAIRLAIEEGGSRGASTISQQTVKNVFLWHGRTWTRKAFEAALTPAIEAAWPKRRILEIYLNVAEFDEGVFGIEAAAQHHFGVAAADLDARQSALLAAVLPNPKERSAAAPSSFVDRRARAIRDGAATIDRDGRADCFQSG
ncbi:Penicillin-binding protein 2D [Roseivivax jejudonensis]|uniref:Biosynthetic peptidoglycan transglycosylase n=1 Tax=Roseivivax jejudonensis TaxID=1529041 RepID=A0A1X7A2Y5_9RHOB|nr:monofunctional biosynthetic peptidoglycan transglycosylase [Roseivivax jejudonensis]SLN68630.1 Penicillin-binding protein 2D [Roseivivax jejudonensis]